MNIRRKLIVMLVFLWLVPGCLYAAEVTLDYNGVVMNGNLELAPGKSITEGVIVITHAGLAHNGMELYVYLQNLLKERGYSSLAVSWSFGISNRHGMYDCKNTQQHLFTDGVGELEAWIKWLKQQSVKKVILLGHSRGGGHATLFLSEHDSEILAGLMLLAPDTKETNDVNSYRNQHHKELKPILEKAKAMVSKGEGDSIMEHTDFLYCANTRVAAKTIVSYYDDDPRLDTANMIPGLHKPVLIVNAGNDEAIIGGEKYLKLAGKNVQVKIVEGAGHFFRDLFADEAVDEMTAFLDAIGF